MEVRCSNCETEYEFDDALVSARGTSVKCTQCGHQFRVRRAGVTSAVAESWLVKTSDGIEINFKSLRELQQGIVQGNLQENDSLTHGGQAPRPLKDIYELQTFFASARARAAHPASKRTLLGGAGDLPVTRASSLPPRRKRPDPVTPVGGVAAVSLSGGPLPATSLTPPGGSAAPPREGVDTSSFVSAPASSPLPAPSAVSRVSVPPAPRLPAEAMDPSGSFSTTAAGNPAVGNTGADQRSNPPPRISQRPSPNFGSGSLSPSLNSSGSEPLVGSSLESNLGGGASSEPVKADVPWQNMQGLHGAESELPPLAGRNSGARSRWIAALVVFGGLALVGGTVGKEYILKFVQPPVATPVVDKRVPTLLKEAYGSLGRGDFEAARIAIAKAEVLAVDDITVAAALARLEVSHAESHWLELRVLKELAVEVTPKKRLRTSKAREAAAAAAEQLTAARELRRAAAEKNLKARLVKAHSALDSAKAAADKKAAVNKSSGKAIAQAPEPVDVVRVRVDLLRLAGKLSEARQGVQRLSAQASNPDNAHTLGALDLAEEGAGLLAAIGRLQIAARRETGLGKSRSLLVYALTRSADRAAAVVELDKLRLMAEQHPLLADLTILVERLPELAPVKDQVKSKAAAGSSAKKKSRSSAVAKSPVATGSSAPSGAVPNNDTAAVEKAERLHRAGNMAGAERLYSAVLSRSPTHIGALSGMGDIYRQRGATAQAMAYYNRVLSRQPMHLRTVMASADMNWAAKRREAAVNLYRRALGQVGTSHPYGARALRRIEEFETTPKVVAAKPVAAPTPKPAATAPQLPRGTPPELSAPVQAAPTPSPAPRRAPKKKKGPSKPAHPFAIPSPVTPPPATTGPTMGTKLQAAPSSPIPSTPVPRAPVGTP